MTGHADGSLVAEGLRCVRGGVTVVDDVSLTVAPGQMMAVSGPSGSGKTTLLSLLAGLSAPESGTVTFAGSPVVAGAALRPEIGIVLQGYGLVPVLTASENVEVALQARAVPPEDVAEGAEHALERVQLVGMGNRLVERLSGGQQQRVAVARTLVVRPALLLADEPTSELDEVTRDHVVRELREEARRGAVVVLATHDPDVMAACDWSVRMVAGRIVPVEVG